MTPNKTAEEIASLVFNALPHINQVWVNQTTQHHYLQHTADTVLIQRSEHIKTAPVVNPPAAKPKKVKLQKQKLNGNR